MLVTLIKDLYYKVRYRQWILYEAHDGTVIYIGKQSECTRLQRESRGGLKITPVRYDNKTFQ